MGDAFLIVFESCTNAVLAGLAIQDEIKRGNRTSLREERTEVRIAVSAGDVRLESGDVFGEAVNIASRLESVSEPHQVWFSDAVFYSMNRSEVCCTEVGSRSLRGIPYEVHVYRACLPGEDGGNGGTGTNVPAAGDRPRPRDEAFEPVALELLVREGVTQLETRAARLRVQLQLRPIRVALGPVLAPRQSLQDTLVGMICFGLIGTSAARGANIGVSCSGSLFRTADISHTRLLQACMPEATVPKVQAGSFRGDRASKCEVTFEDTASFREPEALYTHWKQRATRERAMLPFEEAFRVLRLCNGTLSIEEQGRTRKSLKIKIPMSS